VDSLALGPAVALDRRKSWHRRGGSLVELVVALAVILVGVLAFSRSLTESLRLGAKNRGTALATAAAQGIVEQLYAADIGQVFALYNDDPDDDPDGTGTAPGAHFVVEGLEARAGDAGKQGRILFPVVAGRPGELREDLFDAKLRTPLDLDLDGAVDDVDHSRDYRLLPALVRVSWQDGREQRELEVATILGARR
jgi:hypothetical protein